MARRGDQDEAPRASSLPRTSSPPSSEPRSSIRHSKSLSKPWDDASLDQELAVPSLNAFDAPMTVDHLVDVIRLLGIHRGTGGVPRDAPPGVVQSAISLVGHGIHLPEAVAQEAAMAMRVPAQFMRIGAHYVEQSVRCTLEVHRYARLHGRHSRTELRRVARIARQLLLALHQLGEPAR